MTRSKTTSKTLPPPTPSEAAFERVLESFGNGQSLDVGAKRGTPPALPVGGGGARSADRRLNSFVDQMFAQRKKFLERDDFAGIGARDTFPTKIMGVSFEGRQDVVAGLTPGSDLELQRQPNNPADANAIAVYYGALHVGFLRKQIAKHLAPLIDGGMIYRARIEHVTGGTAGKNFGVNIRVWRETPIQSDAFAVQARTQAGRDDLCKALIGEAQLHKAQRETLGRIDAGKNTMA
ncbi:MAG TPA: HIRAN domain-containing protein, partial [Candidatus Rubrimentiphilum sp.]|nr:HIRAN domain-containing protein [Candidatus Rubrimentiphilum sp.]